MLLFVYTTTRKRLVIFTCRYFKLSWNTTALSQSNCRNFSSSSITFETRRYGRECADPIYLCYRLFWDIENRLYCWEKKWLLLHKGLFSGYSLHSGFVAGFLDRPTKHWGQGNCWYYLATYADVLGGQRQWAYATCQLCKGCWPVFNCVFRVLLYYASWKRYCLQGRLKRKERGENFPYCHTGTRNRSADMCGESKRRDGC